MDTRRQQVPSFLPPIEVPLWRGSSKRQRNRNFQFKKNDYWFISSNKLISQKSKSALRKSNSEMYLHYSHLAPSFLLQVWDDGWLVFHCSCTMLLFFLFSKAHLISALSVIALLHFLVITNAIEPTSSGTTTSAKQLPKLTNHETIDFHGRKLGNFNFSYLFILPF